MEQLEGSLIHSSIHSFFFFPQQTVQNTYMSQALFKELDIAMNRQRTILPSEITAFILVREDKYSEFSKRPIP